VGTKGEWGGMWKKPTDEEENQEKDGKLWSWKPAHFG
jgi:hypothetical protein